MGELSPELVERMVALVHQVYDLRKITGMESPYAHAVYLAERLFRELPKPVDPDLIEARELLAKQPIRDGQHAQAAEYRSGRLDGGTSMINALAAIKRGRELARAQAGEGASE